MTHYRRHFKDKCPDTGSVSLSLTIMQEQVVWLPWTPLQVFFFWHYNVCWFFGLMAPGFVCECVLSCSYVCMCSDAELCVCVLSTSMLAVRGIMKDFILCHPTFSLCLFLISLSISTPLAPVICSVWVWASVMVWKEEWWYQETEHSRGTSGSGTVIFSGRHLSKDHSMIHKCWRSCCGPQ